MKRAAMYLSVAVLVVAAAPLRAEDVSVKSMPPVVVKTSPQAG